MSTPIVYALLGGLCIGLGAILLLLADGKIAGISGMVSALFHTPLRENGWRLSFLGGLVAGGLLIRFTGFTLFEPLPGVSKATLVAAGLLVGFGTQVGSGCTSGHSVCGMGRLSFRSLVATLTFMAAGALTVYLLRHGGFSL